MSLLVAKAPPQPEVLDPPSREYYSYARRNTIPTHQGILFPAARNTFVEREVYYGNE